MCVWCVYVCIYICVCVCVCVCLSLLHPVLVSLSLSRSLFLSLSSCFSISTERYFHEWLCSHAPELIASSRLDAIDHLVVYPYRTERRTCLRGTRDAAQRALYEVSCAYTLVRENHRSYTPRTRLRTSFDCPGWGVATRRRQ